MAKILSGMKMAPPYFLISPLNRKKKAIVLISHISRLYCAGTFYKSVQSGLVNVFEKNHVKQLPNFL